MYKIIIGLFLISGVANAQETCDMIGCKTVEQDVNTPVPVELQDAEIIVRTKDGKETVMKANDFKVVKRKQQFKVKKQVETRPVYVDREVVKKEPINNLIMVGARYDYQDIGIYTSGNKGVAWREKGMVLDLSYMRFISPTVNSEGDRIGDVGLGIGIDTNATVRGILGVSF